MIARQQYSSVTGFSRLEFVSAVVSILQRGLHDKKGLGICESFYKYSSLFTAKY